MVMRQTNKLTILIVDDHLLVRQGLKQLLSQELRDVAFGEAATAQEALTRIKARPWHLVILDVSLPDGDGFTVLREICALGGRTQVLMLSMHTDSLYASRCLELGAAGYISKSSSRADLLKAIKTVLDGKEHFGEATRQDVRNPRSGAPHANLSARESRVLLSLAAGKGTGEIAAELNLSGKTVSTYKRRVLNKLSLKSTADLVRYVINRKLS
jgi:two-component system invasion response regulator UvrY